MDNRELWLAATLVELADGPDADFGETAYSGRLALRLAQLLAPAEVGVLTGDARALTAIAASTERANHLVSFEAGHGEGPGTACYTSGQPVLNESLIAAGGRWPRFAAAARAAGFRIVSSLPIRRHHDTVGVITALGTDEHPLGATEISLAQILAEAAAIAVLQQRALRAVPRRPRSFSARSTAGCSSSRPREPWPHGSASRRTRRSGCCAASLAGTTGCWPR